MRQEIAAWVVRRRGLFLLLSLLVTGVFGIGIARIEIATIFTDLFPDTHEFVHTYKDHPNFGNPLTIQVMVKRRDGDIYHPATLEKVWELTRKLDLAPAVDHDQVISISTEKARFSEATPDGIESMPLMGGHPPRTAEEIREFRLRVDKAPNVRLFLISEDETATQIRATFIEHQLDYGETFEYVQALVEAARDAEHEIYAAGEPMLTGWVYRYEAEMIGIFAVTVAAMLLSLILYMRNFAGVLTPVLVSIVSAIWGFGFVGWLGDNVEPLVLVVPLLLVARSFSHSVQLTERYYEILDRVGDKRVAAQSALGVMMAPGILGIVTDATGLFLIGVAPIPMMEKFSLFCGFWAMSLIPTNVLLSPVLLSYLPTPRNVDRIVNPARRSWDHRVIAGLLERVARLSHGRRARWTTATVAIAAVGAGVAMSRLQVGNLVEGSALLKSDSEYNVSVRELNTHFPGMNTLEIVFEGSEGRAMRSAAAFAAMNEIARGVEAEAEPPSAVLSFADYLPEAARLYNGGNPKWLPLDRDDRAIQGAAAALLFGSNTKNYSHVVDYELRHGTLSLWFKDRKADTIERALAMSRRGVEATGVDHERFEIRLASGTIALQHAVNETVELYQWIILGLLICVIFATCGYAYRSGVAGLLLLVPVNFSNILLAACMVGLGIGLDVNTLPVASIGIGVGIDYGIYLLSRICEEYHGHGDYARAIDAAVTTTGKAIFFTATIVLVGILPWYFLSSLKFLADMGLLLALIMLINMAIALVVVPLLVYLGKPKFVTREHRILSESIAPSAAWAGVRAAQEG